MEEHPPKKYYLTATACKGILRRAEERGKPLPPQLQAALEMQSGQRSVCEMEPGHDAPGAYHINQRNEGIDLGHVSGALMATQNMQMQTFVAFAQNQRDEVRDLHDLAGALGAQPGMKQQTFIASGVMTKGNGETSLTPELHGTFSCGGGQAGQGYPCVLTASFSAGAGASAGTIGYAEEVTPTLKGSPSGNCMPSVVYLHDQGGQRMDVCENMTGTLRASEKGHQPLVYENHGIEARVRESGEISPTVTARSPEIIKFVTEYGKLYGYNFEHEATYDRMCLVNDAVYIARYATVEKCCDLYGKKYIDSAKDICKENKKHPYAWTATGTQFQIPYVFKTLFSKENIEFEDMCETKSVTSSLYLDMNEALPDVSALEAERDKLWKQITDSKRMTEPMPTECERVEELTDEIAKGHDYHFIGKVGQFCPINAEHELNAGLRKKVAQFCNVDENAVIQSIDMPTIYEVL